MIFNIASAALIYQQNSSDAIIDHTMYALCMTDVILTLLSAFISIVLIPCCISCDGPSSNPVFEANLMIFSCFTILNGPFNFVYSLTVVGHYNDQQTVTEQLFNMSLAIIILNSVFLALMNLCSCFCTFNNR